MKQKETVLDREANAGRAKNKSQVSSLSGGNDFLRHTSSNTKEMCLVIAHYFLGLVNLYQVFHELPWD